MILRIRRSDRRDRERPHRAEGNFGRKALGTRPPDTVIPELSDIFLLRAETWAMIIGDENLDRRGRPVAQMKHQDEPVRRSCNQNGYPAIGRKILFESAITH
jgi:hypothetical protein